MSISKLSRYIREYGFVETFFRLFHRLRITSVLHSFNFTLKELEKEEILKKLDTLAKKGKKLLTEKGFTEADLRKVS